MATDYVLDHVRRICRLLRFAHFQLIEDYYQFSEEHIHSSTSFQAIKNWLKTNMIAFTDEVCANILETAKNVRRRKSNAS